MGVLKGLCMCACTCNCVLHFCVVFMCMCMCALCLCVWEGERACVSVSVPVCMYVCVCRWVNMKFCVCVPGEWHAEMTSISEAVLRNIFWLDKVEFACNHTTQKTGVGAWWVQGQLRLHSEIPSQKLNPMYTYVFKGISEYKRKKNKYAAKNYHT